MCACLSDLRASLCARRKNRATNPPRIVAYSEGIATATTRRVGAILSQLHSFKLALRLRVFTVTICKQIATIAAVRSPNTEFSKTNTYMGARFFRARIAAAPDDALSDCHMHAVSDQTRAWQFTANKKVYFIAKCYFQILWITPIA